MTTGVVVLNFGGPQNENELEPFLTELLYDVLPFPKPIKRIAAPLFAKSRTKIVGPDYASIGWSPLVPIHHEQVAALTAELGDTAPPMASAMMFTDPRPDDAIRELLAQGVTRLIALPMFPHYSIATTQAAFTFLYEALERLGHANMPVHYVPAYYDHADYLTALAATIREGVANLDGDGPVHLLFSPHGLPTSFVQKRGDPYMQQVMESCRQVIRELEWEESWSLGWQSKVGRQRWLTPSTPDELEAAAKRGNKRILLVPVSFVSEHIETLFEIDVEYREMAHELGIPHFGRAPALGLQPGFIRCLADLVRTAERRFDRYTCVRCLQERTEAHRRRSHCDNCRFTQPAYLRRGAHPS